jgi:hypothetical protein
VSVATHRDSARLRHRGIRVRFDGWVELIDQALWSHACSRIKLATAAEGRRRGVSCCAGVGLGEALEVDIDRGIDVLMHVDVSGAQLLARQLSGYPCFTADDKIRHTA